jgi:hypothetical protein
MRRTSLSRMLALPALGLTSRPQQAVPKSRILIKSAWGSADPTQASFPVPSCKRIRRSRHEVQVFLLGETVTVMRTAVANSIVPVGWSPLAEALTKVIQHKVPIHV